MSLGRDQFIEDLNFDVNCLFHELKRMEKTKGNHDAEILATIEVYIARLTDNFKRAEKK